MAVGEILSRPARAACLLTLCLLLTGPEPSAEEAKATDDSAAQLKALREQIRGVQAGIKAARDESGSLQAELQRTEAAMVEVSAGLRAIEERMQGQQRRLEELSSERDLQQRELETARQGLGAQIRSAYRFGRNDFVKLLLNQEDPALVGRTLSYHDYFNRARARRIARVTEAVERLDTLEMQIRAETVALEETRAEQAARLGELTAHRDSRGAVIARLEQHIRDQGQELQHLQQNERELAALIERLQRQESVVEAFEELPPFDSLKGELSWPVRGEQAVRFGSPRKGGRLRAEGVTIRAPAGSEVQAVSAGKVVFADWFRNMGLLVIIDHGGGWMSLYGHNEALAKKAGDFVKAGDVIGRVGDTGGQQEPALYFEIRADGAPMDPALWCRS